MRDLQVHQDPAGVVGAQRHQARVRGERVASVENADRGGLRSARAGPRPRPSTARAGPGRAARPTGPARPAAGAPRTRSAAASAAPRSPATGGAGCCRAAPRPGRPRRVAGPAPRRPRSPPARPAAARTRAATAAPGAAVPAPTAARPRAGWPAASSLISARAGRRRPRAPLPLGVGDVAAVAGASVNAVMSKRCSAPRSWYTAAAGACPACCGDGLDAGPVGVGRHAQHPARADQRRARELRAVRLDPVLVELKDLAVPAAAAQVVLRDLPQGLVVAPGRRLDHVDLLRAGRGLAGAAVSRVTCGGCGLCCAWAETLCAGRGGAELCANAGDSATVTLNSRQRGGDEAAHHRLGPAGQRDPAGHAHVADRRPDLHDHAPHELDPGEPDDDGEDLQDGPQVELGGQRADRQRVRRRAGRRPGPVRPGPPRSARRARGRRGRRARHRPGSGLVSWPTRAGTGRGWAAPSANTPPACRRCRTRPWPICVAVIVRGRSNPGTGMRRRRRRPCTVTVAVRGLVPSPADLAMTAPVTPLVSAPYVGVTVCLGVRARGAPVNGQGLGRALAVQVPDRQVGDGGAGRLLGDVGGALPRVERVAAVDQQARSGAGRRRRSTAVNTATEPRSSRRAASASPYGGRRRSALQPPAHERVERRHRRLPVIQCVAPRPSTPKTLVLMPHFTVTVTLSPSWAALAEGREAGHR